MADPLWALLAPIIAPAPLIMAEQNGPRPPKPYATLDVTSAGASPWLIQTPPDENGDAGFIEYSSANVEVQFFGQGAQDRAKALGIRLRLPTNVDRAAALGIGIGTVRPATSLSVVLNETQREERSVLEFTAHVGGADAVTDNVGRLEHIEVEYGGPVPDGGGEAAETTICLHTIDAPEPPAP